MSETSMKRHMGLKASRTVANTLIYNNVSLDASFAEMRGAIGWSLLLNLGLSAVFAGASAWLLDRKVNL